MYLYKLDGKNDDHFKHLFWKMFSFHYKQQWHALTYFHIMSIGYIG